MIFSYYVLVLYAILKQELLLEYLSEKDKLVWQNGKKDIANI